ncbi:MAG: hypothetical protein KatS3mg121_0170 [Gammaproteobacteria bacterium]|nr:MAG: hypothetical protein KatS3mg121_0170 [Gammaproteobacteria bacterium]
MNLPAWHLGRTPFARFGETVAEFGWRHRKAALLALPALLLFCALGLPRNHIDEVFVDYFGPSFEVRRANDFILDKLTGIATLEYQLDSGREGGVADPAYLRSVDRFAAWLERQPEVRHVNVLTDVLKRINRNMHGDDDAEHRLPQRRDLAAQYLLVYELSLPYGQRLDNQLTADHRSMRLVATLHKVSSQTLLSLVQRADRWLAAEKPAFRTGHGVSPDVMFAHIGQRNNTALLGGALLALLGVSLVLVVALRSLRLGLISLVPNLLPVLTAFALWGWLSGHVGLSLTVVGAMTLGVVVDDTIHLLARYAAARRAGAAARAAMHEALQKSATALLGTTVSLVLGFTALAFSDFRLNADMGAMTALTLALALLMDLLLLPALLYALDGKAPAAAPADVAADHAGP